MNRVVFALQHLQIDIELFLHLLLREIYGHVFDDDRVIRYAQTAIHIVLHLADLVLEEDKKQPPYNQHEHPQPRRYIVVLLPIAIHPIYPTLRPQRYR